MLRVAKVYPQLAGNVASNKTVAWFGAVFVFIYGSAVGPLNAAGPVHVENVILITLDGLRWQEVFSGADETLLHKDSGGVKDVEGLRERFWAEDPQERRRLLMPFLTEVIERDGVLIGNPEVGPVVRVTNRLNFSYPGYSELLVGRADPRIDSNSKIPNPNVTVLEWLHRRESFAGRIAAFTSWDVFPYIINTQRSGIPVNAGWMPVEHGSTLAAVNRLNRLSEEFGHYWPEVRYDYITFSAALEYLAAHKPRVLYVSLGETDDWAHARRYDLYLDAAYRNDRYIRMLWEVSERLPEYAGKTTLLVTTDHGRGETGADWTSHGKDIAGCELMWVAALGPNISQQELPVDAAYTQSQVAATVAALLGERYAEEVQGVAAALPFVER